jgi:hypothetical protein
MTPQKVVLEVVTSPARFQKYAPTSARLWASVPECANGRLVLECVPLVKGKSLPGLRKWGTKYAKRFAIPFEDRTEKTDG